MTTAPSNAHTVSAIAAPVKTIQNAISKSNFKKLAQQTNGASGALAPTVTGTPLPQVTDSDVSKPGFLGSRFTYEADLSAMYQGGNTLRPNSNLPGGLDGSLIYKLDRVTRLAASYFTFSATPLGQDDPNTPIIFQGTTKPIGYANVGALGNDASAHLRLQVYNIQRMFFVGGRHHPLVIAPTYATVRSSVGGHDDTSTVFENGRIDTVHAESYQQKSLNLAIPLFYARNYLIAYTGGVAWNMNTNGANLTNHPQYGQTLFAQYQPVDGSTYFASAAKVVQYFPTSPYPFYVPTFHLGLARAIRKPLFVEGEISTGGPSNPDYTNIGRIGLADLTVPCASTAQGRAPTLTCVALARNGIALPVVGAAKYTTFTLMIGIGAAPLVRPF